MVNNKFPFSGDFLLSSLKATQKFFWAGGSHSVFIGMVGMQVAVTISFIGGEASVQLMGCSVFGKVRGAAEHEFPSYPLLSYPLASPSIRHK